MLFSLLFSDYIVFRFIYAVRRYDAADAGYRIYIRAAANDRSRIENAVAADLNVIAEYRAELLASRFNGRIGDVHCHERLVALHVAGYRARAHVRLIAEDGVTDIVIMRHLHVIKQHDVFQLCGVADDGVFADYGAAANKRAMTNLCAVVYDAGCADVRRGEYLRVLR